MELQREQTQNVFSSLRTRDHHCSHGSHRLWKVHGTGSRISRGRVRLVNLLSGSKLAIGQGLKSSTTHSNRVASSSRSFLGPQASTTRLSQIRIWYIEDDHRVPIQHSGRKLSGQICMHCIIDVRMGGVSRRNMNMFRKLCGDETLQNVALVTNMWGPAPRARGGARGRAAGRRAAGRRAAVQVHAGPRRGDAPARQRPRERGNDSRAPCG